VHLQFLVHRFGNEIAQCSPLPGGHGFSLPEERFRNIDRGFHSSNIYSFTANRQPNISRSTKKRHGTAHSALATSDADEYLAAR
jgi:hypothetical protein